MKTRCDNSSNEFYDYYGGRGIKYCEKWKTFEGFWEDMQEGYSDDLTLSRRDNDAGYYKGNCEWDTKNIQGHIKRKLRVTWLKVIGGSWDKRNDNLYASIKVDSDRIYLGEYRNEEEIAEAYDMASEMFYGDRPNKTSTTRESIKVKVEYYLNNRGIDLRPKGSANVAAKLNEQMVAEIWSLLQADELTQQQIAEKYGVLQSNISVIKRGAGWNHVTNLPKVRREKIARKLPQLYESPGVLSQLKKAA